MPADSDGGDRRCPVDTARRVGVEWTERCGRNRFVVCHNPEAAERDAAVRDRLVAYLTETIAGSDKLNAEQDRLLGDARGDEVPEGLRDRSARRARLDAALRVITEREQAARAGADAARWVAEAWAAADRGEGSPGRPPKGVDPVTVAEIRVRRHERKAAMRAAARDADGPVEVGGDRPRVGPAKAKLAEAQRAAAERGPTATTDDADDERPAQANTTDPDSRTMKTANGWVQGYNAQAAVSDHHVVVAADVTQDHNDVGQARPMMTLLAASLLAAGITAHVGMLLFDAGYCSADNATAAGPDRLIATTKDWKRRKQLREQGTVTGDPPQDATVKDAMEHRLCTAEGAELYAKRSTTVEPTFGDIKHNRGFDRFVRRGLSAVRAEWLLITATGNLLAAYRHRQPT